MAPVVLMMTWLTVVPAPAAVAQQQLEALGPRALGMGGAFVAVADDATAVYWNPAGLATGAFFSLMAEATRSATGPDDRSAAAVFVGFSTITSGVSYYRLRSAGHPIAAPDDGGAGQSAAAVPSLVTHHVGVTRVAQVGSLVSVGTTLRYVRGSVAFGGVTPAPSSANPGRATPEHGGRHVLDADIGVLAGVPALRVGMTLRNLRSPTFGAAEGPAVQLERQVRLGVATRPLDRLVLAMDLDATSTTTWSGERRMLAVGGELVLGFGLAVRTGARWNLEGPNARPVGAVGLSVAVTDGVYLDAQLTRGAEGHEQAWTLAGRIGL